MTDRRDAKLDGLIDDALRRMAGGDGPADMQRRVLARLAEPPRPGVSRGTLLAAAAAIVLAASTALVLRRPAATHAPVPATDRRPRAASLISPPPTSGHFSAPAPAARLAIPSASRPAGPSQPLDTLASYDIDAQGSEMEAIGMPPLAVSPMETRRPAIAPLLIDPMKITPLSQPDSE